MTHATLFCIKTLKCAFVCICMLFYGVLFIMNIKNKYPTNIKNSDPGILNIYKTY